MSVLAKVAVCPEWWGEVCMDGGWLVSVPGPGHFVPACFQPTAPTAEHAGTSFPSPLICFLLLILVKKWETV